MPLLYALQLLKFQYFEIGYFPDEVDIAMARVGPVHGARGGWCVFDG
jgi:hypothetical protein